MSVVYLAYASNTSCHDTLRWHAQEEPVDLLVAVPELRRYLERRHEYNVGKWSLDSGAFSAWKSNKGISLKEYIDCCRDVDAYEIFGLDVINDYRATQRNLERIWAEGIRAIPTFHQGEPWDVLDWCCKHSEKIALSAKGKGANQWIQKCFARVWPKMIHGFAMASRKRLAMVPFDSVDASSWLYSPSKMGNWAGYSGTQQRVGVANKIGTHFRRDFWVEVVEHQKRAKLSEFVFRKQLAQARERNGHE